MQPNSSGSEAYRDVNLVSISLTFIHNLISLILFRMTFLFVHLIQHSLRVDLVNTNTSARRFLLSLALPPLSLSIIYVSFALFPQSSFILFGLNVVRPLVPLPFPILSGMERRRNAEMQVTLKLASYFHTNVRDLSQYAWSNAALSTQWMGNLPGTATGTTRDREEASNCTPSSSHTQHFATKTKPSNERKWKRKEVIGHCWKTNCTCDLFTITLPFHIYWNEIYFHFVGSRPRFWNPKHKNKTISVFI